MTMTRI